VRPRFDSLIIPPPAEPTRVASSGLLIPSDYNPSADSARCWDLLLPLSCRFCRNVYRDNKSRVGVVLSDSARVGNFRLRYRRKPWANNNTIVGAVVALQFVNQFACCHRKNYAVVVADLGH
jgi:hypothetical protein